MGHCHSKVDDTEKWYCATCMNFHVLLISCAWCHEPRWCSTQCSQSESCTHQLNCRMETFDLELSGALGRRHSDYIESIDMRSLGRQSMIDTIQDFQYGTIKAPEPFLTLRDHQNWNSTQTTIFELDPVNRERLLLIEAEKLDSKDDEVTRLLDRILDIDPQVHRKLNTKMTAVEDLRFRLMTHRYKFLPKNARNGPIPRGITVQIFIAVSYCWHSEEWNVCRNLTKVKGLPLSEEMMRAICCCLPNEGVWIDQLCIDQSDPEEKKAAVAAMDIIYRSARLVVVVLEDITITDEEHSVYAELILAHHVFHRNNVELNDREITTALLSPRRVSCLTTLCQKLFTSRWFQRAWCSHEYFCAKAVQVLVSKESSKSIIQLELPYILQLARLAPHFDPEIIKDEGFITRMAQLNFGHISRSQTPQGAAKPLWQLFSIIQSLGSTLVVDKVTIALNLMRTGLHLEERDISEDDACYIVAIIAMADGDASCLTQDGGPVCPRWMGGRSSWLSRATRRARLDQSVVLMNQPYVDVKATILPMSSEFIDLDLLLFPSLAIGLPIQDNRQVAADFVESRVGIMFLQICGDTLRKEQVEQFVEYLAVMLELGMEWIMDMFASMHDGLRNAITEADFFHKSSHLAVEIVQCLEALGALHQLPDDITLEAMGLPLFYMMLTLWQEAGTTANWTHPMLAQLANPRFRGVTRKIALGANHVLAMPKIFTSSSFNQYQRLWMLEPVGSTAPESKSCWRVVHKTTLVGTPDVSTLCIDNINIREERMRIVG